MTCHGRPVGARTRSSSACSVSCSWYAFFSARFGRLFLCRNRILLTLRKFRSSGKASRSREEIELVFDKNKGAIFALYNRALRRDPSLEGKLVLRLTIDPNGAVSFCEIVSSELGDSELERKLVQRVKLFRFEARDVEAITTTKPIDFFPA